MQEEEKTGDVQGQEVPEKTATTTTALKSMEEEEKEVMALMSHMQAQVYQEFRVAAEGYVKKLINP